MIPHTVQMPRPGPTLEDKVEEEVAVAVGVVVVVAVASLVRLLRLQ